MAEKEKVVFYAYKDTDGGRVLSDASIIMRAKKIEDPRTHSTTWDFNNQEIAQFAAGVFATTNPLDIEFLRNYNTNNPDAIIIVREEMLHADGSVQEVKLIADKFIPISIVKDLDITAVRKILKDEFNYDTKGESLKDILAEGKEK